MSTLYLLRFEQELVKLRRLERNESLVVIVTDLSGRITSTNNHFSRFTGYSGYDAMGKQCKFMQRLDDSRNTMSNQEVVKYIKRRYSQPLHVAFYNITKNNTDFIFYSKILPIIRNGSITGYYSFQRPIPLIQMDMIVNYRIARKLLDYRQIRVCNEDNNQ